MAIDFPDSPSNNDIYTVNGKRWIYSNGKWSIYGSTAPDATASDTEPTGVGDGHIWYRSDQSQTLIRYDNTWVEVGSAGGFDSSSTNFPTSLDSATGFAAVEALQAKVGVNSSGVATSHDYKIAQLEALGELTAFTPSWTNFTVGNATEGAYYVQVGKLVVVRIRTILGSTSSMGTNPEFEPPVGAISNAGQPMGNAILVISGVRHVGIVTPGGTDALRVKEFQVSGANVLEAQVTATSPATWATGDRMDIQVTYLAEL